MKGFMVDLDGTLWKYPNLIDGSKEAIEYLRKKGKVIFCTNASTRNNETVSKELNDLGIKSTVNDVTTAYSCTIDFLKNNGIKRCFAVISDRGKNQLKRDGITLDNKNVNAVLIGHSETSKYSDYDTAFRLIKDGAKFIGHNKNMFYPRADGFHITAGTFISGLEEATSVKAEIFGKPSERFFASALDKMDTKIKDTYMIGDDILMDIRPAKKLGFKTVFVEGGTHKKSDIKKLGIKPDHVIKSIKDISSVIK